MSASEGSCAKLEAAAAAASFLRLLGQRPSEQQDVRFWFVDHIMDPSLTLLHAKVPPFRFRHQMGLGDELGDVLGQHDMPATEAWEGG